MNPDQLSSRIQLVCAWAGPFAVLLLLFGCIVLGGFIPPPSPAASGEEVAKVFSTDTATIRIGCVIVIVGLSLLAPWGVAIAVRTRAGEGKYPILSTIQIVSVAIATTIAVLIPTFWAVAAFRPTDVSPDITRMLNDCAWFIFLFMWPPFSIWCVAIAASIFSDTSEQPVFPRWAAYLNILCATGLIPAGMIVFFKHGPFGFNGLMALYEPLFVFCLWMLGMTVALIQSIKAPEPGAALLEPTPVGAGP